MLFIIISAFNLLKLSYDIINTYSTNIIQIKLKAGGL